MKTSAEAPDLAEIDREEVKKERSLRFGGERDQLAFVFGTRDLVDVLQIGRLAAETGPVVDDLAVDFPGYIIYEGHAASFSSNGR